MQGLRNIAIVTQELLNSRWPLQGSVHFTRQSRGLEETRIYCELICDVICDIVQ